MIEERRRRGERLKRKEWKTLETKGARERERTNSVASNERHACKMHILSSRMVI